MGAKAPAQLRLRRGMYKCELCSRKLLSPAALKSHQLCVHSLALENKAKALLKSKQVAKNKQTLQKKKIPVVIKKEKGTPPAKTSKAVEKKVLRDRTEKKEGTSKTVQQAVKVEKKENDDEKTEFQCPKCEKLFSVSFLAHRHIQKHHCVNSKGEKVSPSSIDLIKPIRIELCGTCKTKVKSNEWHSCVNKMTEQDDLGFAMYYVCSGCNQQFVSLKLFDLHVSGLHSDGVESMFFQDYSDFLDWKHNMEEQTKVKYSILGKYNSKQMYRCTFLPSIDGAKEDTNTARFCPSTIVVQEFSKGIQVHYYTQHYGHCHEKYVLRDKYKEFTITTLIKQIENFTDLTNMKSDKADLYIQFKTLMECIVLDAAKMNMDILRILIGKALDMTSILTKFIEEEDLDTNENGTESALKPVNREKSMTDDQISNVLEGLRSSQRVKRKVELVEKVFPKKKSRKQSLSVQNERSESPQSQVENQSPKILNSFSLAENTDLSKMFKELESKETENEMKNSNGDMKTKKLVKPLVKSPSFNDQYKDFVDKNFKTKIQQVRTMNESDKSSIKSNNEKVKKKAVVKTKMGQFKPSVSPKTTPKADPTPKNVSPKIVDTNSKTVDKETRTSFSNVKVLEYEVKEQENDCNILILKI